MKSFLHPNLGGMPRRTLYGRRHVLRGAVGDLFYVALSLRERIADERHAAARDAAAIFSQSERAT